MDFMDENLPEEIGILDCEVISPLWGGANYKY